MEDKRTFPDSGSSLLTRKSPHIITFLASLDRMLCNLEQMSQCIRPTFNGERYLTDKEVCERLKISRRSLLEYRNIRKLPYCKLGGKILYRESDLERLLESSYRKASR